MLPILIFVMMSLAVGWVGRDRQLGFLGTFVISMILSPLLALIALVLGQPGQSRQ